MEFQVGHRPGRAANRLAVHAADEGDEGLCPRKKLQNIPPLVVERRPADLDEPHVVGAGIAAQLFQPGGVESGWRGGRRLNRSPFVKLFDGGMLGEFHRGAPFCCIYKYWIKILAAVTTVRNCERGETGESEERNRIDRKIEDRKITQKKVRGQET